MTLDNRVQVFTVLDLSFNFLPHSYILDQSKLKGFADDKIYVTQRLKCVLGRVENIVGTEGENAGYQHFLFFQQCCQNASYIVVILW